MDIIFICYWGIGDPLTISTVLPNVKFLSNQPDISTIHLITVERQLYSRIVQIPIINKKKIIHYSINERSSYISKALTSIKIFNLLLKLKTKSKTFIIARSSLSAIPALFLKKLYGINFSVESYEPHSKYMLHNNIWSRYGLKFNLLNYIENRLNKHAFRLYPVSQNFKKTLIKNNVSEDKISVMPCAVDQSVFYFNQKNRDEVRNELNLNKDSIVGIYVGKFGGLYFNLDSMNVFLAAKKEIENFHLILLSPENKNELTERLLKYGFSQNDFTIIHASHNKVPNYLSAADFAFALIKTTNSSHAMSPIKIGEYYASGLPIAITPEVGDDSDIMKYENAGEIIEMGIECDFKNILSILEDKDHRKRISKLAEKYRSQKILEENYKKLLKDIVLSLKDY